MSSSSRPPTSQNSSSLSQSVTGSGSATTVATDDEICHTRIPQTTAFTVHFDNENKFTKRHVRNLSLPISKLYDGKVNCDSKSTVNGKTPESVKPSGAVGSSNVTGSAGIRSSRTGKAAGNHSEGYFSSDAEDDPTHPKLFVAKLHTSVKKASKPTNLAQERKVDVQRRVTASTMEDDKTGSEKRNALEKGVEKVDEEGEGDSSDGVSEVSETGTYTIDKEKNSDNVEVITARLNIDNAFGVNQQATITANNDDPNNFDSAHSSLSWVNDWATHVVEHNSLSGVNSHDPLLSATAVSPVQKQTSLPPQGSTVSKIPSPISSVRAQFRLNSAGTPTDRNSCVPSKLSPRTKRSFTQNTPAAITTSSTTNTITMTTTNRQAHRDEYSDSSLETESFLLATERVVSAMAARVSLSMDSGGESDVDTSHSCSNKKKMNSSAASTPASAVVTPASVVQSDSSASESGGGSSRKTHTVTTTNTSSITTPTATTRYNRAFSLRRGRLDDPNKKETKTGNTTAASDSVGSKLKRTVDVTRHASTPPSVPSQVGGRLTKASVSISSRTSPTAQSAATPHRSQSFTRTDCGRYSMRSIIKNQSGSPLLANQNKGDIVKKKGSGGRSNSTLSSREVEFQNWKRRKSYDPMKAAAEGKKKEAAKKQLQATTISISSQTKSSGNPVLRSASFHGTRQLTMPSSSEEDDDGEEDEEEEEEGEEDEVVASAEEYEEEEDWPAPAAPRTSLESTPRGSRVSLYSNTSNSSLRSRPKLEGVDNLVISALSGLSGKVKVGSCNLLKKLRYLYDEDSPKSHQLTAEIEQLEVSDPGSPHHSATTNTNNNNNSNRSPSRELSTALRNLKRIESVVKVLDNVLFDNEDFH